jgi:uncharacterized membrane protein
LPSPERWRRIFAAALTALAMLVVLCELWLAPLRPGGSWLALKALPLAVLWVGVARGRLRAAQWALLLLPLYFAEGVVRAWSESGRHAACAVMSIVLALVALVSGIGWVRSARPTKSRH